MRIISYTAMIATAAFCQLSFCMNKADNPVNGNQLQPIVSVIDVLHMVVPTGFNVSFESTNKIKINFRTKEVVCPCMQSFNVSGPCFELVGSELISIEYRGFLSGGGHVETLSCMGAIGSSIKNARGQSVLNSQFSVGYGKTDGLVVEVDLRTKIVSLPSGEDIRASVSGSEWQASISIIYTYPDDYDHTSTPRAFQTPFVGMRQTIERKEEKAQQKMGGEREIDSEDSKTLSEDFKIPKKKTEESKPPKRPNALKTMEDSRSHSKKGKKKEAKKIRKFERKGF